MSTASETLQQAMALHRAGRLGEAEQTYARVPMDAPEFVDAVHLAGVIALQRGNPPQAIDLITRAVQMRPDAPSMHSNLAEAYRAAGKLGDAIAHCRAALNLDAGYHACRVNMALALAAQGKLPEAEAELLKVIRAEPHHALAFANLANVRRAARRFDEALAAARKAVQLEPANAEFLSNLGQMLVEDGDFHEAVQRLENAVKIAPRLAAARNNLGNALRELGRLDEAEMHYQEALKLSPQLAITHNNMGQLNQERGNYPESLRWYEQSLKLDPRGARTACNLASALTELDRYDEARDLYEQALKVDPTCAEAWIGLGTDCQRRGETRKALEHYNRAEQTNARLPAALTGKAGALAHLGDFEQAQRSLRRAIEIDPRAGGAWEQLARIARGKVSSEEVAAMKRMALEPTLREAYRISLHYAIAAWAESAREFGEAARHLQSANTIEQASRVRRGLAYNAHEHTEFVDGLIRVFDAAHFRRTAGWGLSSEVPVFVLGLPRSGTTLVEQVLASHPRVFGADELKLARESLNAMPGAMGLNVPPLQAVPGLTAQAVASVAERHLSLLREHDPDADRIVDKMPENYLNIGVILTLFPNARIIHLRRDLRDVATSCWGVHFGQIRWANVQGDMTSHFRNYWRVMEHWRATVPNRIFEVRYEEMVQDLETHARKLLEYCGLEWDERVLQFHKSERTVKTASVAQVRQPLYKASVARWKHYEPWLGEWFTELDAIQRD